MVAQRRYFVVSGLFVFLALFGLAASAATSAGAADSSTQAKTETAVFSGGCFWGVDGVFKHVKGVSKVVSGYAGGTVPNPSYEMVSTGTTGYAESVQVTYDPSKVSYDQWLKVFFLVAHDPTELNRQGPDEGTQYRSAIFYTNEDQKRAAQKYIAGLDQRKAFPNPIVTQLLALQHFYAAEDYHQNFLELHPDNPYIAANDLPKIDHLRSECPDLYKQ
ncbi:MAG TPA: peptide-methionine (S)-S-oxide reductase MsrA [Candidatus Binataceae bacterium]